jgi:hypothetical protein
MAHEQELMPPRTLPAGDKPNNDERWPVSYAITFIAGASMALWAAILAVSSWLIG